MASYLLQSDNLVTTWDSDLAERSSRLIDAYLQRPEGMIWQPDYHGMPAYMTSLVPSRSLTANGAIAAGVQVPVTVLGGIVTPDIVGTVVVVDRGTLTQSINNIETAIVASIVPPNIIVLDALTIPHPNGCTLDWGLLINESRKMPQRRAVTMLSRFPIQRVRSALGRYGYGRRGQQAQGIYNDVNLLAVVSAFGGPPPWIPIDPTVLTVDTETGETWVPAGMLLSYFTDVRFEYTCGWQQANVPYILKSACAQVMTTLQTIPEELQGLKSYKAGNSQIVRADNPDNGPESLSNDVKEMLKLYKLTVMG